MTAGESRRENDDFPTTSMVLCFWNAISEPSLRLPKFPGPVPGWCVPKVMLRGLRRAEELPCPDTPKP